MEYHGTWKEIWEQKGKMEGTIADLYIYDGWEKSKANVEITAKKIITELDIQPEDKVLEVGCGAGALAQYMECQYVGIDYSRSLVKRHLEFFRHSVLQAEANDLPFKDNYFDKCFSWGVFLYFESDEYVQKTIHEMIRVTKQGILVGELPEISHDEKHHLYRKEMFHNWNIQDAWTEQYKGKRFIATWKPELE